MEPPDLQELADAVKRLRWAARLTQDEVAKRAGVHVDTVRRIERADPSGTTFSGASLTAIAHALGLPGGYDELLAITRPDTSTLHPTTEQRLADLERRVAALEQTRES